MFSSHFTSPISALNGFSRSFQQISDNIANATTEGYKAGQVRFNELVNGRDQGTIFPSLSGTSARQDQFIDKEGTISLTNRSLDAAITGHGYFVTSTSQNPLSPRDGSLELTASGRFGISVFNNQGVEESYITDTKGNFLLGWPFDPVSGGFETGTTENSLEAIRVDRNAAQLSPVASTSADVFATIPAESAPGDVFNLAIGVFDGTGTADGAEDTQTLDFQFVKTATPDVWNLSVTSLDGNVTSPSSSVPVSFNADGSLASIGGSGTTLNVNATWAAPDNPTSSIAVNFSELFQFGNVSSIDDVIVNGNGEGVLQDFSFNEFGEVVGAFSNGLTQPVAKIALGDVVNPNGLLPTSETHYQIDGDSGELQLFEFDRTSRARLSPEAIEESTTDIAGEFTNLIATQRAYSSNSTSLQTIDEMIRIATELK